MFIVQATGVIFVKILLFITDAMGKIIKSICPYEVYSAWHNLLVRHRLIALSNILFYTENAC